MYSQAATLTHIPTLKSFDRAVGKSQVKIVRDFIKIVPDYLNLPNTNGYTALGNATNNNDEAMVELLLESGANVNLGILKIRRTPLHVSDP